MITRGHRIVMKQPDHLYLVQTDYEDASRTGRVAIDRGMLPLAETPRGGKRSAPGRGLSVTGRRRDESESQLQDSAVVTDHRPVVVAGPTLANAHISYVTRSLRYETVPSAKTSPSADISDCCIAKNGTSQP
jgi:hypothetical protein